MATIAYKCCILVPQILMNAGDKKAINKQLAHPLSPKVTTAFVNAMSDKEWVKNHASMSIEGIHLIPKTCSEERCRIIKAILGSDMRNLAMDELTTMLWVASVAKNWDLAIELLQILGPAAFDTDNLHCFSMDDTILHLIAAKGTPEELAKVCTIFTQHGKTLDVKNGKDETPLGAACKKQNLENILQLVDLGADINLKDFSGETLLHKACDRGDVKMATHLVALGLDVNAKDKLGMTPLHHAASSEEVGADLIKGLVDLGADVKAQDKSGNTPLHFARRIDRSGTLRSSQTQAMLALLKAGADPGLTLMLLLATIKPNLINSELMDILITVDNGSAAEYLERKLLAHRFGLKGTSFLDGKDFELEGLSTDLAVEHLQFAVKHYYAQLKSALTTNEAALWNNILVNCSASTVKKSKSLVQKRLLRCSVTQLVLLRLVR